jgi:hypothetical protein
MTAPKPKARKPARCSHPRFSWHVVCAEADPAISPYMKWCAACGSLWCRDGWTEQRSRWCLPALLATKKGKR